MAAVSNNDNIHLSPGNRKEIAYQIHYRLLARDVNHTMTFPVIL